MSIKKRRKFNSVFKRNDRISIFISLLFIFIIMFLIVFLINKSKEQSPDEEIRTTLSTDESKKQNSKEIAKLDVRSAIDSALKLLEVPNKFVSTYHKEKEIVKYITINSKIVSLTIANITITDLVKKAGANVISVKEDNDGTYILMEIYDPQTKKTFFIKIINDLKSAYPEITKLAIIIDDFGYFSGELLDEFLALDKNITFSILPGSPYSKEVETKAIASGHECLIHIPMEPQGYPNVNPGENAILMKMTEKEIKRRVESFVQELPHCIGANNHMGSIVTQYKNKITPVLEVIQKHNLFFVDSKTTNKTIAYRTAKNMNIPAGLNDIFLDTGKKNNIIDQKYRQIIRLAKYNRQIIAISHCHKEQLEKLKKLLSMLPDNIKLVPISEIVIPKKYIM